MFLSITSKVTPVESSKTGGHVALLGDSIFDNKVYVADGPAVIDQVRDRLGPQWNASLLAIDGHRTDDVATQLDRLPEDATHLVLSVGGNDALWEQGVLTEEVSTSFEAFKRLSSVQQSFGNRYAALLDLLVALDLPITVCTVYDPHYDDPAVQQVAVAALSVFNDRITRQAFHRGLPVIDLRVMFTASEDYANPIEPGVPGGVKIAEQVAKVVKQHDFSSGQTVIYGR